MPPPDLHLTPNGVVSADGPCFIIAEIGQNHQGDLAVAKTLIRKAKEAGADCVKFQKTHLPSKFNRRALERPYSSQHAFGKTYGEHKQHLEFTHEQFHELQIYAEKEVGIPFTASAMDKVSLDFLRRIDVPFIKIGSGDNTNYELISKAAVMGKPIVLSTGMMSDIAVLYVYKLLTAAKVPFAFLHCVSCYPVPFHDANLLNITELRALYSDVHIGYSGHEVGTEVSIGAVALGAKIIERHFTMDKTWKGSDHVCSLEPDEFASMVRSIRIVETALGKPEKRILACELPCIEKLGKSVVTTRDLAKGHLVTMEDVCVKVSEPRGIPAGDITMVIGCTLRADKPADEPFQEDDLENPT